MLRDIEASQVLLISSLVFFYHTHNTQIVPLPLSGLQVQELRGILPGVLVHTCNHTTQEAARKRTSPKVTPTTQWDPVSNTQRETGKQHSDT